MADITLNIYGKNKQIIKTLEADGYDLMMGTVEDFISIIDLDKANDPIAVARMLGAGYEQIKPLLRDIFPDMTDEDFRGVRLTDLVGTAMQICTSVVKGIRLTSTNAKNRAGA